MGEKQVEPNMGLPVADQDSGIKDQATLDMYVNKHNLVSEQNKELEARNKELLLEVDQVESLKLKVEQQKTRLDESALELERLKDASLKSTSGIRTHSVAADLNIQKLEQRVKELEAMQVSDNAEIVKYRESSK